MLVPVRRQQDILPSYLGSPIEALLGCHNFERRPGTVAMPQMIVVTCMDHRIALTLPERFAFVLRTGGANVEPVLFNIACAMAINDIRTIAVIGHSDCAMVDVARHHECFMQTAADFTSMTPLQLEQIFDQGAREFGCTDAVTNTLRQCARLREFLPGSLICPLFYDVADNMLYQIETAGAAATADAAVGRK